MAVTSAYSVVRFSPCPEQIEYVNVALMLFGSEPEVRFDPDFPRLHCIEPGFDRVLLAEYLRALPRRIAAASPDMVCNAVARISGQLELLPLRDFLEQPTEAHIERLFGRYLASRREGWRDEPE